MASRSLTHSEGWWETLRPDHVLRCTASLKRDGSQCRREAIPGSNVCRSHGGLAPAVQAKAAARIGMSVDDAAKKLLAMVEDPNVENREKVKILHDLLDRGGLAPTSKHLIGVVTDDPVEALFRDIAADPNGTYDPRAAAPPALQVRDAAQEALDAAEATPDWGDLLAGREGAEDVVDAELVEETTPAHTRRVNGSMSDLPPKRIRDDLKRLGLL